MADSSQFLWPTEDPVQETPRDFSWEADYPGTDWANAMTDPSPWLAHTSPASAPHSSHATDNGLLAFSDANPILTSRLGGSLLATNITWQDAPVPSNPPWIDPLDSLNWTVPGTGDFGQEFEARPEHGGLFDVSLDLDQAMQSIRAAQLGQLQEHHPMAPLPMATIATATREQQDDPFGHGRRSIILASNAPVSRGRTRAVSRACITCRNRKKKCSQQPGSTPEQPCLDCIQSKRHCEWRNHYKPGRRRKSKVPALDSASSTRTVNHSPTLVITDGQMTSVESKQTDGSADADRNVAGGFTEDQLLDVPLPY